MELFNSRAAAPLATKFVTVMPQTNCGWSADTVRTLVSSLLEDPSLQLDPTHLYCTGVSMGGYVAWLAGTTGE